MVKIPNFLTHHKHIFIPEHTVYIFCMWPDNGFLKKPIQLACTVSLCVEPFKAYWSRDAPTSLRFNNCILCPHHIYVFCVYLRTNSNLCHLHYKLIGFYNQDEKCLQCGTDWVLKLSSLRFVFKRLIDILTEPHSY